MESKPFNVGNTTKSSLGGCSMEEPDPKIPWELAQKGTGTNSLSDGALARITPLAVWCQNLDVQDLEKAVKADVTLTHS